MKTFQCDIDLTNSLQTVGLQLSCRSLSMDSRQKFSLFMLLSTHLRQSDLPYNCYRQLLKTFLFAQWDDSERRVNPPFLWRQNKFEKVGAPIRRNAR